MTDKEIIKALEKCSSGDNCDGCMEFANPYCMNNVMEHGLDLIKRQQKMIDALIAGQETLQKHFAEMGGGCDE